MKKIIHYRKIAFILLDWFLLNSSYVLSIYFKRDRFFLDKYYLIFLFLYNFIWILSILLARKFVNIKPSNFYEGIRRWLRSFFYMVFLVFFLVFLFKLFSYSRQIILSSILIYLLLTILFYLFVYLYRWGPAVETIDDDELIQKNILDNSDNEITIDLPNRVVDDSLMQNFLDATNEFWKYSSLIDFIKSSIRTERIKAAKTFFCITNRPESIRNILSGNLEIIGNFMRINKFQRINQFFIAVNEKLAQGGYYFGLVETIEQRRNRKYKNIPVVIRQIIEFVDFLWMRVFPKVKAINKLYFAIHRKGERVISRIEILGRLIFCGFKIVSEEKVDNKYLFVVKKVGKPRTDATPSYSAIFKQKRIGKNGADIFIYKFRTMHPFSEYLHEYFLSTNKLNAIGKVHNDPRITGWGKIMRRFWLDEIPMIINFLQGDLKMVGVRPISRSFNRLYPDDLRKNRTRYKPGLLPSIYADKWSSIEDIFNSERKYLDRYQKHPLSTDLTYFFKIIISILLHKTRSA